MTFHKKAVQRFSSSYVQSAGYKIMEKIKADVLQLPIEKAPKGKPKGKAGRSKKDDKMQNKYS